jgi:hypothetical protein
MCTRLLLAPACNRSEATGYAAIAETILSGCQARSAFAAPVGSPRKSGCVTSQWHDMGEPGMDEALGDLGIAPFPAVSDSRRRGKRARHLDEKRAQTVTRVHTRSHR